MCCCFSNLLPSAANLLLHNKIDRKISLFFFFFSIFLAWRIGSTRKPVNHIITSQSIFSCDSGSASMHPACYLQLNLRDRGLWRKPFYPEKAIEIITGYGYSWITEKFSTAEKWFTLVVCWVDVLIEKFWEKVIHLAVRRNGRRRKNILWSHLWWRKSKRLKARKEFVTGRSKFRSSFSGNIFESGGKEFSRNFWLSFWDGFE